jgi:hypothetical protein
MKPQFNEELDIIDGGKAVKVVGPIDLAGQEEHIFVWVVLSQPPDGRDVFGQGTGALLKDEIGRRVKAAKSVSGSLPVWEAAVQAAGEGTFREGPALAQAVVIMQDEPGTLKDAKKTPKRGMWLNVYWSETVLLKHGATQAEQASA